MTKRMTGPVVRVPGSPGRFLVLAVPAAGLWAWLGLQCVGLPATPPPATGVFNNTTDPTNDGASYIGSAACSACHFDIAALHNLHGHANVLNPVQGQPPEFPSEATGAGVPEPPTGFSWSDISYVVGGYRRAANFLDEDGFLLTTGVTGVDVQWNLASAANGSAAGFASYEPTASDPTPFEFECFRCHTTGAQSQDPSAPTSQDNRPGIEGTWEESGVQCEACHGPGSKHVINTSARNIFVDTNGAQSCNQCHNWPFGGETGQIPAADGYLLPYTQSLELAASGGHSEFSCTFCHNPHASVTYDRDNGVRNACTTCHSDQNMALHEGKVFMRGDYTETLSCESCHMPFAARLATSAGTDIVGDVGRMGDTRTHIFRIDTREETYEAMFSDDMSEVLLDEDGLAAVTIDFVCFRCHNGIGAFTISLETAAGIADNIHSES